MPCHASTFCLRSYSAWKQELGGRSGGWLIINLQASLPAKRKFHHQSPQCRSWPCPRKFGPSTRLLPALAIHSWSAEMTRTQAGRCTGCQAVLDDSRTGETRRQETTAAHGEPWRGRVPVRKISSYDAALRLDRNTTYQHGGNPVYSSSSLRGGFDHACALRDFRVRVSSSLYVS